jgi:superoxide reductase
MCEQKFFRCKHCGNLLGLIKNAGVPMICCGEKMEELVPNTVEASVEKHLPVFEINGDIVTVNVGSVPHPMTEEHHIEFIYLQTENGGQRKCIKIGSEPQTKFSIVDDNLVCVFAYCNLHGLWKADFKH